MQTFRYFEAYFYCAQVRTNEANMIQMDVEIVNK